MASTRTSLAQDDRFDCRSMGTRGPAPWNDMQNVIDELSRGWLFLESIEGHSGLWALMRRHLDQAGCEIQPEPLEVFSNPAEAEWWLRGYGAREVK